jgi:hypothetical protein
VAEENGRWEHGEVVEGAGGEADEHRGGEGGDWGGSVGSR